ncbi:cell division transport system permease protein [Pseudooceanicola antarcticus]|uniref:Cell division protein FtsX n=1 Tax=Pseudooceanicola antarcticus TaxID=1247613 RepID=A0A285IK30_9RHOB|nr:FtsX-like permease family protein [Pseudooceanicola antarcticus]PJE28741.1 cell division protein FtsX [Pseudooceanicola antarcticus]SNY48370.1 cell division transport system permease protein [Pseudooceanicola antarcticus]
MSFLQLSTLLRGEPQADRVVPPTGFTARLTLFAAAAMAFLAVFALALSLATGRLASNWSEELARSSTLRISAPAEQVAAQTEAALQVLATTSGVARARALSREEQQALLEPWFGPDLPVDSLPIPQLIEIIEDGEGYDPDGLRLRLAAEVPGAVLDDHGRWRRPLVKAAGRIRALGLLSLLLIGGVTAAMITLAANSALAANAQVIAVLRLVGARDDFIARAFVRRFTFRAFWGASLGMALGLAALLALPEAQAEGGFLTGLGLRGWHWVWPLVLPFVAAFVSFLATGGAARRMLRRLA